MNDVRSDLPTEEAVPNPAESDSPNAPVSPSCFETLLEAELESIGSDRSSGQVGIALSGGGIRSATFCLGVLEALRKNDLLDAFDYLTTVSGGGYTGGFWDAWRRSKAEGTQAQQEAHFPEPQSEQVEHLRRFSDFLRPRPQLLSYETGRIITTLVAVMLPTLLATIGLVALILGGWALINRLVLDLPIVRSALLQGSLICIGHAFVHWVWQNGTADHGTERRAQWLATFGWLLVSGLIVASSWLACWWLVPFPATLRFAPVPAGQPLTDHALAALLPSAPILFSAVVLVLLRAVKTWFLRVVFRNPEANAQTRRAERHIAIDRAIASTLYLGIGTLVFGGLWLGGLKLAAVGVTGIVAAMSVSGAGGSAFAILRSLLNRQPNKPKSKQGRARFGNGALQMVAYVTLAAGFLTIAALLSKIVGHFGIAGLASALIVACALASLPLFFDSEEEGAHGFYRARLSRAFLGAAKLAPEPGTQASTEDDFPVTDIPEGRPFHLICCAANDLAGDPLPNLHRGAASAVVSRLGIQLGDHWSSWTHATSCVHHMRPTPTLGAALTASAAAFNSHMGAKSVQFGQAVTFLMTTLNLRLGLWTENPLHHCEHRAKHSENGNLKAITPFRSTFYRELLGQSDVRQPEIFLSDGGHFENLGLYELIRRRCKLIVVCDCGADPEYAFDDLANAIRRVRTDLQVEINIDVSGIKPGEDGRSEHAIAIGEIGYCGSDPPGLLLLIKPALTGGEPEDIRQYVARSEDFPQQTTADQFYDEAQWEAYRKLGEHIAGGLIDTIRPMMKAPEDSVGRVESEGENQNEKAARNLRWGLTRARHELRPCVKIDPRLRFDLEHAWARLEAKVDTNGKTPRLAFDVLGPFGRQSPSGSDDDVGETLRQLTKALSLLETARVAFELDRPLLSRDATGWQNRAGRWATAPAMRNWWPWLAPSYSRGFVDFMESTFELAPIRDLKGKVERLGSGSDSGYALDRWNAERNQAATRGTRRYGFYIEMGKAEPLMAALVDLKIERTPDARIVSWSDRDLYLPGGFWAVGIAGNFVDALISTLDEEGTVDRFEVRIAKDAWNPSAGTVYSDPRFELMRGEEVAQRDEGAS